MPLPAMPASPDSPVTTSVAGELRRVQDRWRVLPLDEAQLHVPAVNALVQSLADRVAQVHGRPPSPVPDLGAGTVMDQLAVMVYDASMAAVAEGLDSSLAALRRSLR